MGTWTAITGLIGEFDVQAHRQVDLFLPGDLLPTRDQLADALGDPHPCPLGPEHDLSALLGVADGTVDEQLVLLLRGAAERLALCRPVRLVDDVAQTTKRYICCRGLMFL